MFVEVKLVGSDLNLIALGFFYNLFHSLPGQFHQSGMVIKFDNHVTSQHGGHFGNRGFSYAIRVFHFLFGIARLMYP